MYDAENQTLNLMTLSSAKVCSILTSFSSSFTNIFETKGDA